VQNIDDSTRKTETPGLAVKVGAAMGVMFLTTAACGGTLEGRYRRGELPGHPVPTSRNPQGAAAAPTAVDDVTVASGAIDYDRGGR
jgi:hypothetical protein